MLYLATHLFQFEFGEAASQNVETTDCERIATLLQLEVLAKDDYPDRKSTLLLMIKMRPLSLCIDI